MVVYLDVLLMENFIVNFFLLYFTIKSLGISINYGRLLISSAIGTMYVITYFYDFYGIFNSFICRIIITYIMILLILFKETKRERLKAMFIYFMYTFALVGLCFILAKTSEVYVYKGMIFNFSSKKLLLGIIIIFLILNRVYMWIRDSISTNKLIYDIEVELKSSKLKLKAFLDTGNELREPISNLPVIFVEGQALNIKDICEDEFIEISYRVINGQSNLVKAFKPKSLIVSGDEYRREVECYIAITNNVIGDNRYNALLSRGVIY